ncbi:MAG: helical backbone metal receptor [Acidimicrobiales bacterium]|jgi:ABC-type Fe3+-hydroxamate transport system substrate-binding protein
MNVVSLVPSVTETLLAWGIEPTACTRFCEQPSRTHVGGTKDPDIDQIVSLRPDLVVVDEEENRREDYEALLAAGLAVHALAVRDLSDVNPAMEGLARRVGGHWDPLPDHQPRPTATRAFVPIWRRPWMALGAPTYGTSLLTTLGIENVFADDPYPTVTLDEALARHPGVVLAPSEPYPFSRRQLPELESVAPTVFVDGKDLFWWGARTADALERLEGALVGWR